LYRELSAPFGKKTLGLAQQLSREQNSRRGAIASDLVLRSGRASNQTSDRVLDLLAHKTSVSTTNHRGRTEENRKPRHHTK